MTHNTNIKVWCAAAAALVLVFINLPLDAQAADKNPPDYMTYQSYLTDANGVALGNTAPLNYDVIFSIYNHQSDSAVGNLLWSEQQTVTVDKGYFSVLLGEGSAVGGVHPGLSTLFTGTDISDRFVQMTVKKIGAGGTDSIIKPRLRLMTSPYAFVAKSAINATTLVNSTNSAVVSVTGGYVGINKLVPTAALDVTGAAAVSGQLTAGSATVTGTLTAPTVNVSGALTAGNAAVSGTLTAPTVNVSGTLTATTLAGTSLTATTMTASGVVSAGSFVGNGTIPVGGIIMWSGAINTIPAGWTLCNGVTVNSKIVPNLTGRFILGAGGAYAMSSMDGAAAHTLTPAEMPAHTHNFLASGMSLVLTTLDDNPSTGDRPDYGDGGGYGFLDLDNHPTAVQSTGSGTSFSTLPPYYVLAYIMRVQ